ncbi:MAG: ATP-binding cassette domain-containing protein [Ignavibacteriales bacterium]|nr:ATP-binding cassette domain-containing protein [Ignavibacteriales bacterium]
MNKKIFLILIMISLLSLEMKIWVSFFSSIIYCLSLQQLENVSIPQMIKGVSLKSATKNSLRLLEIVGLKDRAEHKPAELSGGEQQRVAVARALANDPKIIFADEPTGNLDSANSDSIHKLLFDLRDNFKKTFVIVTHNPALMELADVIFEIKDGVINQTKNKS